MTGTPLGVAVIGLGVGEQHARKVAVNSRCRLARLLDLDQAKATDLAQELGAQGTASSLDEILADPEVDVVVVASFDDDHFQQTMACLRAGKHVFVEKPMCRTRAELEALKALWGESGGRLKLGSNLILRTAPLYVWLKKELEAGTLGTVYSIEGEYLYGRLEKITQGWRSGVENYSVMEGGGVHLIDLMLWLTGQKPDRLTAAANRICAQGTAFRYNDFETSVMIFPSGMIGRITANFGCVHRHQHVLRIYGTQGTFLYDDAGARLHRSRDPWQEAEPVSAEPLPVHKGDLLARFISAVTDDAPEELESYRRETESFFHGLAVCLAADEATERNTWMEVDYS